MISVCIATYNGEKYIEQQVQSILCQLGTDDEILISDDDSSDNTIKIIESIGDRRIRLLSSSSLLYKIPDSVFGIIPKVSRNFYNALLQAKGDTIYLCDQDDVWLDNKVGICENLLSQYEMILHRRTDVNSNLELIGWNNSLNVKIDTRDINICTALSRPPFQGACMCFTKRVQALFIKNFDIISKSRLSHDHVIGFLVWVLLGKNKILFTPQRLILYRRHGANVSSTGEKSNHSLLFKLAYRLEVCKLLVQYYRRRSRFDTCLSS